MEEYNRDGFLSENIDQIISKNRKKFSGWFDLCLEVNAFFHDLLSNLKIQDSDEKKMVGACLSLRASSTFQGIIILAERGMVAETRMLLRCLMELMFSICALTKNENFVKEFILEDQRGRLKIINKLKASSKKIKNWLKGFETESLEEKLKKEINKKQIKHISTYEIAQKAGMTDHYNTAYSALSSTIHPKIKDLEEYLLKNDNGEIVSFRWIPANDDTDTYLLTAIECTFFIFNSIYNLFNIKDYDNFVDLQNRLKPLAEELKKKQQKINETLISKAKRWERL